MTELAPPLPEIVAGRVAVIVTVLKDPRVARTLESLLDQERPPDEIIVDDGGRGPEVERIAKGFAARDPRVRYLLAPGNIPESRNMALRATGAEFLAFLDADEVAPRSWLKELLRPFEEPKVGFTGGPTPGMPGTTHSIGARYYDGYLRRFYDVEARRHPHALPMGNSAWRAQLFRQVGLLDTTLYRKAASEDQEIAVRALEAGWQGRYVPEAWVDHDFSDISTWGLLRKQRIYAEGGYVVWRRRGTTYEASPLRLLPYVMFPAIALVSAVLAVLPWTRSLGLYGLAIAAAGLLVLAGLLTWSGYRQDRRYPGLRYRALEILRRWATLWGALHGLVEFGWQGRSGPATAEKSASVIAKP